MSTTGLKRGKLSNKDLELIKSLLDTHDDDHIASRVRRTPEFIAKIRKQQIVTTIKRERSEHSENQQIVASLRSSYFYSLIKSQLTKLELVYFEQSWVELLKVWNDTNAADQMMLRDLIILDIHANRAAMSKKELLDQMEFVKREIELELRKPIRPVPPEEPDPKVDYRNPNKITAHYSRLNEFRTTVETVGKEHKSMQDKKDEKYKQLKLTRQERFKQIEEARKNIWELLKQLDEIDERRKQGRINGVNRLAAQRAKEKFEHVTIFEDNEADRVFLTPESLDKGWLNPEDEERYERIEKGEENG